MKFSIKPIATAVSLAVISVSAHAQLAAPAQGTTPSGANGLFLELYNTSTNATELVNLGYGYTDVTAASGHLAGSASPFVQGVANPTGAAGTVAQLNFGNIANFGDFTANSVFTVAAAATATQTGIAHIEGVEIGGTATPTVAFGGMAAVINNIQGEIANWNSLTSTGGTFLDATGGTTIAGSGTPSSGLSFGNAGLSGAAVGSSLSFYNILGNTSATGTFDGIAKNSVLTTQYSNGFFFLNANGDLTYNVTSAGAPVPLPAAVWLFGSGLLGLAGIGRRRAAV
jgi:hypothetical protein